MLIFLENKSPLFFFIDLIGMKSPIVFFVPYMSIDPF